MSPLTLEARLRASAAPHAADVAVIVGAIAECGRSIAHELARASLVGQLGTTGDTNVQGESVAKLDLWSNNLVVGALEKTGLVSTLVSEEMEAPREGGGGRYVVCFDPVDGSSNLDINGVVGTIFSIRPGTEASQPGTAQVAAGYVMYGPAVVIVVTVGEGVDVFALDVASGRFLRSHAGVRMPARGKILSINDGNSGKWEPGVREYVGHVRQADPATGRPYTSRYVGSLVADFHRTLLEGGIFLYPAEAGKSAGKLRLQYEAAPVAFLAEQAGGRASTGRERIMDMHPSSPHQRVPLIVGSAQDVAQAEAFITGRHA